MKKAKLKLSSGWIAYIVLIIVLLFLPNLFTNNYVRRLVDQALINMIVVMGLNFIAGMVGQMNLGTAGMYALGAYSAGIITTRFGVSMWIGLLGAIVMALVMGVLLGVPCMKQSGIYLGLTTMAFGEIVRLLLLNLTDLTGGPVGLRKISGLKLFGIAINNEQYFYYFLLGVVVLMSLIAYRIINSKWGRTFKAIKDSPEAAESCGLNVSSMKFKAFTLSCIYICIGGALYASLMGYISPADFTGDNSIRYLMMLLVGGIGSLGGNALGAILVTLLPEMLRFLGNYYQLVFCLVVLLMAVFVPCGLISIVMAVKNRVVKLFKQGRWQ